jgi:tetratricopeptide (TPR) repeat protein
MEPNRFDAEFRDVFWERTSGHPLFSVELLSALKRGGGVALDSSHLWTVTDDLDWRSVPGRVEGLMRERIGRLPNRLRDLLREASIEGDTFTLEILADLEDIPPRQLISLLSGDLQRTHMLIEAQGVEWVADRSLSRYRFTNKQVHEQVYSGLDSVEVSYGHRDVAAALEHVHNENRDIAATQIAYHYEAAGNKTKAAQYLLVAARTAADRYAHDEARALANRGLGLADHDDPMTRWGLLLVQHRELVATGDFEAAADVLQSLAAIARTALDDALMLEVSLLTAELMIEQGDWEAALGIGRDAVEKAQGLDDSVGIARARLAVGLLLSRLSRLDEAEQELQAGLRTAQENNLVAQELQMLTRLGLVAFGRKDHTTTRRVLEAALEVAVRIGDQRTAGRVHQNLGISRIALCDFDYCRSHFEETIRIGRQVGDRALEVGGLASLGESERLDGRHSEALDYSERALEIARDLGSGFWIASQLRAVSDALTGLGRAEEATEPAREAIQRFRDLGSLPHVMDCLTTLAIAQIAVRDEDQARETIEEAIDFILDGGDVKGAAYPFRIYATILNLLDEANDPRAETIFAQAANELKNTYPDGGCLPWHIAIKDHTTA